MAKYIDADKLKAEIERRIKECEATYPKDKGGYWFPGQEESYAIAEEYKQLLSFLGTLEDGASEKPNNHMEIVNDLTIEVPTRAVQLPDGRWVTEAFANNNCIYGRKPEERHCEYCSANCSAGHDFQRTKGLDDAANAYSNEHNDDCFDAIGSVCPHIIEAFKAGYNLCKEQMMDEWLKERDGCFWDGVNEGKKAMKEQMLKDAVKWLVDDDYDELTDKGRFILGSVGIGYNGYYIPYSDLLKLPKED